MQAGHLAAKLVVGIGRAAVVIAALFLSCSSQWQDVIYSSYMVICLPSCTAEMLQLPDDRVCTSRAYSFWMSQQELLTEQR